ncbi:MAG: excinuclease ABC subunit UvrC [Patescibacteria group bacterium]|jgi:excinuclease ABC subunit C
MEILQKDHKTLPTTPGVYLMKDDKQKILYVGKAINLRSRISSYFQKRASLDPAKAMMVGLVKYIEVMLVSTEQEALLLEATLIKKYLPPYNVVMRDDKYYLYIAIDEREEFPTLQEVRRLPKHRMTVYGPYASAGVVHQTLKLLKNIFGYRTCEPNQSKACFDYHLGRCRGVCIGKITPAQYRAEVIQPIKRFLSGRLSWIEKKLENDMAEAAHAKEYERAGMLRDQLHSVQKLTSRQVAVSAQHIDVDVLSLARDKYWTVLHLFRVREGKMIDQKAFLLKNPAETASEEIFAAFMEQYYAGTADRPKRVLMPVLPASAKELEKLLGMKLTSPRRGALKRLLEQGTLNADAELARRKLNWAGDAEKARKALEEISRALKLVKHPKRIETYDISNNQGAHPVGSMIVFEDGQAKKDAYKKFTIKTIKGPNDPHMMAEMLRRRLQHLPAHDSNAPWPAPDLIILDGGKSQLGVVGPVIKKLAPNIPYVGLAKKEEELIVPGRRGSIRLPETSEGLYLLQRMRDEAHRFAITFYRGKHRKAEERSILDDIPGIGPKLKKGLLLAFGSVDGIRKASFAERVRVVGKAKAELLEKHL